MAMTDTEREAFMLLSNAKKEFMIAENILQKPLREAAFLAASVFHMSKTCVFSLRAMLQMEGISTSAKLSLVTILNMVDDVASMPKELQHYVKVLQKARYVRSIDDIFELSFEELWELYSLNKRVLRCAELHFYKKAGKAA